MDSLKRRRSSAILPSSTTATSPRTQFHFTAADLNAYLYGYSEMKPIDINSTFAPRKENIETSKCMSCRTNPKRKCPTHVHLETLESLSIRCPTEQRLTRALTSFPSEVQLCKSSIPGTGLGVCARQHIPVGTWIGPYEGRRKRPSDVAPGADTSYMWEIFQEGELMCYLDASDENESSWMRFILCARYKGEQNLSVMQYYGNIYYRVLQNIEPNTELLVWYDDLSPQYIGLPLVLHDMSTMATNGMGPLRPPATVSPFPNPPPTAYTGHPISQPNGWPTCMPPSLLQAAQQTVTVPTPVHSHNMALGTPRDFQVQTPPTTYTLPCEIQQRHSAPHVYELTRENVQSHEHQQKRIHTDVLVNLLPRDIGMGPRDMGMRPRDMGMGPRDMGIRPRGMGMQPCSASPFGIPGIQLHHLPTVSSLQINVSQKACDQQNVNSQTRNSVDGNNNDTLRMRTRHRDTPNAHFQAHDPPRGGSKIRRRERDEDEGNHSPTAIDNTISKYLSQIQEAKLEELREKERLHRNSESEKSSSFNSEEELEFKVWKCEQCQKSFAQQQVLQLHICPCVPEKPYKCNYCPSAFGQSSELRTHAVIHSGKKTFKCGFCSRLFAGSTTLDNHIRAHTGERPFDCDKCGKSFSQASQLSRHNRTPFECL